MTDKIYDTISEKMFEKLITLKGKAVDSKAGACLKIKDEIVFIEDISSWEDELYGKELLITGILKLKKIIPDVVIEEDGAISQGAPGEQYILEKIKEIKQK
ncbi:MAG: hypothetical protein EAX90_11190 [Candidatus Heimdallarchaeota archaeon]|nr:hypothetical protein [Candidatus Heimdallarchaeota archaeon]